MEVIPAATAPTAEGSRELVRDGGRKAGTHLPQDAGLRLSPNLGSERDDLGAIIRRQRTLPTVYGISVPSLSCPLDS